MNTAITNAHRLLADMPDDKRAQVLRLLALPTAEQLCEITGPCDDMCDDPWFCDEDHPITGILTADRLLDELLRGVADPGVARDVLDYHDRGHRGPGPDDQRPPLRVVK